VLAVSLLAIGIKERSQAVPTKTNPLRWGSLKELGREYWLLVAVALLFNLGNSSEAFLLLRSQQIGIAPQWVPMTLVMMNVTYALSAYPLGRLSDWLGKGGARSRYGLLVGGYALYALVYVGFATVRSPWQMWVLLRFWRSACWDIMQNCSIGPNLPIDSASRLSGLRLERTDFSSHHTNMCPSMLVKRYFC
jgi:MFS family permease